MAVRYPMDGPCVRAVYLSEDQRPQNIKVRAADEISPRELLVAERGGCGRLLRAPRAYKVR